MNYRYQKPNQIIADYVRTVLIMEGFSEPDSNNQTLFTNGMPAMLCRTERDKTGTERVTLLTLYGKSIPADLCVPGDGTTIIIYFFKPFVLSCLFNIPAIKLIETPIELCNWNPHKFNALRIQLFYAVSTSQKIEILDNFLIQTLFQNRRNSEIVKFTTDQIMYNSDTENLSAILKKIKLNERTFQRIFRKYVGVTLTQYRRICQFNQAFSQLKANNFNKLTDVAFDNGFADQSHFIRSFKEFAQTTPKDYLRKGLTDKNR